MKKQAGFGREEIKERTYDKYIGRYVIIYVQGQQTNFSGQVNSIKEGYIILNPFQGGEWDVKKGLIRKLIYDDSTIRVSDISVVEPITKENLERFFEFNNRKEARKLKDERKKSKKQITR
ncbi:hypothetical protein HYT25_02260 [Candidatus Pacearchaeota archaeon]|nr:hypothetical protein [Candidatus Pacearchaeota archaeon]